MASTEDGIEDGGGGGPRYLRMQSEPPPSPLQNTISSFFSFHHPGAESARIFDELPKATIIQVSRPDAADISPLLLTYTIEFSYKQGVRRRRSGGGGGGPAAAAAEVRQRRRRRSGGGNL